MRGAAKVSDHKGKQTWFMVQFSGNSWYNTDSKSLKTLLDSGSSENVCSKQLVDNHGLVFDPTEPQTYEMMD
jgi:hypothetical protein